MKRLGRRELLQAGMATGMASAGLGGQTPPSRPASRPNILLIMDDQHRGDCTSAAGNPGIRTPNIDRIGAEGVRFRCAYSTSPTCTPARSALLTGLSPWNHGMLHMVAMGQGYRYTKPRALRDAGYYTLGIGKMHYDPQRNLNGFHHTVLDESGRVNTPDFRSDYRAWFWSKAPHLNPDATGIGFNDYPARPYALPEELHPTRWTGETACHFLDGYSGAQPFFLKVSFARPHSPYDPPERFLKPMAFRDIPKASVGGWAAKYAERSGPKDDIWHGDLGAAQVRKSREGYYGNIEFIDEEIGKILSALEKRGWLEQTLILFTSDHGDMTGDHHLWRKSYAYEASAHIPMAMRWPEGLVPAKRGQVLSNPVELRDVFPTFLDAAGIEPRAKLDGRSMLNLLRGGKPEWREYIDLEHGVCYSVENNWNGFTDGRIKYIFHAFSGQEQLFRLDQDPHELHDLAGDPASAGELHKWRQRMVEHLSPRGDAWVKDGRLQTRKVGIPRSPNFPNPPKPA